MGRNMLSTVKGVDGVKRYSSLLRYFTERKE